jgi:hypothetical protein
MVFTEPRVFSGQRWADLIRGDLQGCLITEDNDPWRQEFPFRIQRDRYVIGIRVMANGLPILPFASTPILPFAATGWGTAKMAEVDEVLRDIFNSPGPEESLLRVEMKTWNRQEIQWVTDNELRPEWKADFDRHLFPFRNDGIPLPGWAERLIEQVGRSVIAEALSEFAGEGGRDIKELSSRWRALARQTADLGRTLMRDAIGHREVSEAELKARLRKFADGFLAAGHYLGWGFFMGSFINKILWGAPIDWEHYNRLIKSLRVMLRGPDAIRELAKRKAELLTYYLSTRPLQECGYFARSI